MTGADLWGPQSDLGVSGAGTQGAVMGTESGPAFPRPDVCLQAHTLVCILCAYIFDVHRPHTSKCLMCVHTSHVFACVYMCASVHALLGLCPLRCMYVHAPVSLCPCVHVCLFLHVHVSVGPHVCRVSHEPGSTIPQKGARHAQTLSKRHVWPPGRPATPAGPALRLWHCSHNHSRQVRADPGHLPAPAAPGRPVGPACQHVQPPGPPPQWVPQVLPG